ncbi:MAG: TldD/PmbA family protein [Alphaproteobacteria bacterium]|nr:TldD/PmbA family protein [Alphaproteobacteria bacterium]
MAVSSLDLLSDLVASARKAGADTADAVMFKSAHLGLRQRLGKPEMLERSESQDLGLRVLIGKRQASVSSTDPSAKALAELVERAVAMARLAPEDPYCGIADADAIAKRFPDLDLNDPAEPAPEALESRARETEDAARAVPGVTNSEGADATWSRSEIAIAASNGFSGRYARSGHGVSVSVVAGEGTAMETDYDYSSSVYGADLESAATVGRRAGERTVRRLNPRKAETSRVPIVFEPRVAASLVSHIAGAVAGPSIARKASFLKDQMGKRILSQGLRVVDDPLKPRGLRSRPFDGEGIAASRLALVEDGVLESWLLDLASARQLGLVTTGHAARGTSGPPSPSATNLYLEAGTSSPEALMADIKSGFYVTSLMGHGINMVTGDYSRGASGFWIENGKLAYPVSEVTVAGNLKDMFQAMTPADDLQFRMAVNSPTLRVEGMTVAGR